MKRKIAVILAADAAYYAERLAADDAATLSKLEAATAIFTDAIAVHDGQIFNRAGAALLAEFVSAVEAVRCALAVQAALGDRGRGPDTLGYRIGITIGDILVRDGDLLGDGVNIASRLMGIAPAGGVCVSRAVAEQVGNRVDAPFGDLGLRRLKNIPEPVHAFSVGGDGAGGSPVARLTGLNARRLAQVLAALVAVAIAGVLAWNLVPGQATPPPPGQAALSDGVKRAGVASGHVDCRAILERTQLGDLSAEDRATLQRECQ